MTDILTIDARGLMCPQPVLVTRQALTDSGVTAVRVLVDNAGSRDNVARFAVSQGCAVETAASGEGDFEIRLTRSGGPGNSSAEAPLPSCAPASAAAADKTVVFVGSNAMGNGDDSLGLKLMRGFLRTWIDVDPRPWRMIFINSGVRLTTTDEEAVDAVSMLAERGVEIFSCGTCLAHFQLEGELKVGKVTNMFEIIESMKSAGKVISPA
jgi:selenium metabolism protein YedF